MSRSLSIFKNEVTLKYSISVYQNFPTLFLPEVCFAGRSNVGKSSLINSIIKRKKIASVSSKPGHTKKINFFDLSGKFTLVDLPGYGYARVPDSVKQDWHQNMSEYFDNRECIRAAILVMDCRHPFKPFDQMMLEWCVNSKVPINILLTKSDKLKKGAASAAKLSAIKNVSDLPSVNVQLFSSLKKEGVSELSKYLDEVFEINNAS